MSRPRRIDPKLVAQAQAALTHATHMNELRAAQAVLLPAVAHTTLEETAALLGVSRASVPRLQQRFREGLEPSRSPRRRWGGRRRALMTLEEEKAFLAPWAEQARTAGMLVVSPLRAALAEKLGRKVAPSVVYRLLVRHGWRKVAPETRHPKSGPAAQAEWEKTPPSVGAMLTPEAVQGRPVRLMFQDEARFGRMARPKRCWAPAPLRPVMGKTATSGSLFTSMEPSVRWRENWTGG